METETERGREQRDELTDRSKEDQESKVYENSTR